MPMVNDAAPLSAETMQRLARLHNRHTLYEMVLERNGATWLLCYGRNSGSGLADAIHQFAEKIVAFTGSQTVTRKGKVFEFENGWKPTRKPSTATMMPLTSAAAIAEQFEDMLPH